VLRRIFGPIVSEVAGGWRRLRNDDIHMLYASIHILIKSRRMRCAGHVARTGKTIKACNILVGKPEGWENIMSVSQKVKGLLKKAHLF